MATPNRDEYVTIDFGASTLLLGSAALYLRKWDDLLSVALRAKTDILPGAGGTYPRDALVDEITCDLEFQANGAKDEDGGPITLDTDEVSRRVQAHTLWGLAQAAARWTGTATVTLVRPGALADLSAACRMDRLSAPKRVTPILWEGTLRIIVPTGQLV